MAGREPLASHTVDGVFIVFGGALTITGAARRDTPGYDRFEPIVGVRAHVVGRFHHR